jgi:hypothetical protein
MEQTKQTPRGKALSAAQLASLAKVTPADIEAARAKFKAKAPERINWLLDGRRTDHRTTQA